MSKKYHYVYYSYEEYGRGYIGSRSCSCLPQEDRNYFGSFTDGVNNVRALECPEGYYKGRTIKPRGGFL
jgi:hypothetical protein